MYIACLPVANALHLLAGSEGICRDMFIIRGTVLTAGEHLLAFCDVAPCHNRLPCMAALLLLLN
jgi:hypothetical protein